jgi:hypothetical protein
MMKSVGETMAMAVPGSSPSRRPCGLEALRLVPAQGTAKRLPKDEMFSTKLRVPNLSAWSPRRGPPLPVWHFRRLCPLCLNLLTSCRQLSPLRWSCSFTRLCCSDPAAGTLWYHLAGRLPLQLAHNTDGTTTVCGACGRCTAPPLHIDGK